MGSGVHWRRTWAQRTGSGIEAHLLKGRGSDSGLATSGRPDKLKLILLSCRSVSVPSDQSRIRASCAFAAQASGRVAYRRHQKIIANSDNRKRIHRFLDNQRSYRQTDASIRFSALNTSIHPLEQRRNRSLGPFVIGLKTRKSRPICIIEPQPVEIQPIGGYQ